MNKEIFLNINLNMKTQDKLKKFKELIIDYLLENIKEVKWFASFFISW